MERLAPGGEKVADHVDRLLRQYEKDHVTAGCPAVPTAQLSSLHGCGFTRRLALSCLVDADHSDTARHYGAESEIPVVQTRWNERLAALERYVGSLPGGSTPAEQERNQLRQRLFQACREASIEPRIRTCDAPVGTGKTTAVMAHLLRVAAERDPELRHIIVVLPYTNIITQSVEVYRKALTLDGERPEDVVAEHHHRADFEDLELRRMATLWKAPIIVTTAVQFFETLGSSSPARLRKLHELPSSAVFVDEVHAAIPSHLWPQMWRWVETWTRHWGGHLVLASGSLPRFWQIAEYRNLICGDHTARLADVPDLVTDQSLRDKLKQTEAKRIHYFRRSDSAPALTCRDVVEFVTAKQGPRLLIVNTVQTAAVIAKAMRDEGRDVLHLSTALAPAHRDSIVKRIKLRLKDKIANWTLVATSCIEAGMDFSFRVGFRERASMASLIQIGGRVSRGNEFTDSVVWDILLQDDQFQNNPALLVSRQALDRFTLEKLNESHPAELATLAMSREWTCGAEEKARKLIKDEESMEYPSVSRQCRVIDADTRTVVIDRSLAEAIRRGDKVSKAELLQYSVQIWANKIEKLGLQPLVADGESESGLFGWPYDYDPEFLGYMAGVLKLADFIAAGGAVI
ncbi:MAG: CRISPR-associated protein [Dehalococcoidia bacterium]|nr:CRISPR-associated protein [Dehalococcoidia bacterium]